MPLLRSYSNSKIMPRSKNVAQEERKLEEVPPSDRKVVESHELREIANSVGNKFITPLKFNMQKSRQNIMK